MMKELDRRMAEIERRSRELIKRKKRNTAVLLGSIPIVLCVGIWLWLQPGRPAVQPEGSEAVSGNLQTVTTKPPLYGAIPEGIPESPQPENEPAKPDAQVYVSYAGTVYTIDTTDALLAYLQELTGPDTGVSAEYSYQVGSSQTELDQEVLSQYKDADLCTWTVQTAEYSVQYVLDKDELQVAGRVYTLTETQKNALLAMLQITKEVEKP